jgi:hypothetical protein
MRRTISTALYILDMGLLIWALQNVIHGKGVLLLIGWLIFTPLAYWGMRRIDRAGWDKWLSEDVDWWW